MEKGKKPIIIVLNALQDILLLMIQDIGIIVIKIVIIIIILILRKILFVLMKKSVLIFIINLLKINKNALIIAQMMIFSYMNSKIIAIITVQITVIS